MTFGTLAAMMIRDAIGGVKNPWRELFDVQRSAIARGPLNYLRENADYPYYLVRDRFAGVESRALRRVPRGGGMLLDVNGEIVAASRDQGRPVDAAVAGVHAPWLPRGLEHDGKDVGLSVSRLAIHRYRRGPGRAGRAAARATDASAGDQPREGVIDISPRTEWSAKRGAARSP